MEHFYSAIMNTPDALYKLFRSHMNINLWLCTCWASRFCGKLKNKKGYGFNFNPVELLVYLCFVELMCSAKARFECSTSSSGLYFYVLSLQVSRSMSAWCTDVSVGRFYHCSIYSHFQVLLMSEPQLPEAPCKQGQIKYPNMNHKTWLMFRIVDVFHSDQTGQHTVWTV